MTSGDPSRRALVTGFTGQDGSFLTELLLGRGYRVIGLVRSGRAGNLGASEHLREQVELLEAELLDPVTLRHVVAESAPQEIYHLAAPSFVPEAWRAPAETLAAIAGATAVLLEAVRDHSPDTRVFLATSSTIFGSPDQSPQTESTPFRPDSPYGVAKLAAHQLAGSMRAHEGLFVCSGILYNHESERRPEQFVSRKITRAAAAIKLGRPGELVLGDLDAVRDWSFAGDVMAAAWLMLQQERPDDYVVASGAPRTVRELMDIAFAHVGISAADHVRVDEGLVRPREKAPLVGDPTKARTALGWEPKVPFEALIRGMVDADLRSLEQGGS